MTNQKKMTANEGVIEFCVRIFFNFLENDFLKATA